MVGALLHENGAVKYVQMSFAIQGNLGYLQVKNHKCLQSGVILKKILPTYPGNWIMLLLCDTEKTFSVVMCWRPFILQNHDLCTGADEVEFIAAPLHIRHINFLEVMYFRAC